MSALTLVAATAATSGVASSTTCPSSEWIIYGRATFVKEMCASTISTNCGSWDYAGHASSVFQGSAGRLVHRAGSTPAGGNAATDASDASAGLK